MTNYSPLTLTSFVSPTSQDELATIVQQAHAAGTPLYPIGGGTSLDYGLPPKQPGIGVVLTGLQRVIDFPARDLTITVEAGITMRALADVLALEGLRLPVDVPHPERATLGGVIATAWSGPRRYGHGSIRDFVIGIRAIDGQGNTFNGGGRVVKNVAGYDFCKLLTGSLGTLGIITQVTLKLRPIAQQTALVRVVLPALATASPLLDALAASEITPVTIEIGRNQDGIELFVLLEGTPPEVAWMLTQLHALVAAQGLTAQTLDDLMTKDRLARLVAGVGSASPLVVKASVAPSQLARFVTGAVEIDPAAQWQAHAGNGIVCVAFPVFPKEGLSRTVVGKLQPLAVQCGGHLQVISNPGGQEATPQSTWGTLGPQQALMASVKTQFDPRNLLNPGRFIFP